ncbi:MAG: tetratricopeptide repeat protein [Promethearchaeota archaeon]
MPNQTQDKITHAQKLKDQCKFKEALEILCNIENVNELTEDDQISFYLLQSVLFFAHGQYNKTLDIADWVFQKNLKTGNEFLMLDASLARGFVLIWNGEIKACNNSILKCEELILKIKDQPEKIIGKRKANLFCIKAFYHWQIGELDKLNEYSKICLDLSEKYGTKQDKAMSFCIIGVSYIQAGDFTKGLEYYEKSIKLSKELNDKMLISYITFQMSWYYWRIGKFDKFLEYSKKFLALSEKYGTQQDIARAFHNIGVYYSEIGDFKNALENQENAIKIREKLNDKIGIASGYNNIGEIYGFQGNLNLALEYYEHSLSLNEEMGQKAFIAANLDNIGLTYYEKGELDEALNYLKKSLQLKKELGNNFRLSGGLFYIIPIYLDQNELESAQICMEELKNLSEKEENKRIYHRYQIVKSLFLKKTGGTRNIVRAEDILNNLIEDKSIENRLSVIILLNLCELLYKELQTTNEIEILEDLTPLIKKLFEISEKMHSFSLLAEVNIFKAKFELINLEIDEGQRLLTRAQQIAQKFDLSRLEKKISLEHDQLLEKLDIWKELKDRNAPISERLRLVSLEGDLNLMMRKKEIEQVEILPEEPLLLSIISKGGISLFTHFFSKEWENKHMFSSFMDAFNSFSNEFFSKTLDRVKIGENTIIMVPFEDKILCYVIKGQTYPAQQKLNKFSEGIKNSKEILNAINRSFSTGAVLNEENTPVLGELVNAIFV